MRVGLKQVGAALVAVSALVVSCGGTPSWEETMVAHYEAGTLDLMGEFGDVDIPIRTNDAARKQMELLCEDFDHDALTEAGFGTGAGTSLRFSDRPRVSSNLPI